MQVALAALLALVAAVAPALAASASPIAKVLSLISDLQVKVIQEGETTQKEYTEFAEWCEERSRNVGFEITTGTAEVASLKAAIDEEAATVGALTTKVEQLAADTATDEADLKAATEIRVKENVDFAAEEKSLLETTDAIQRAIGILEREIKGGASMLQLRNAAGLTQALAVMVQASLIATSDVAKLTAFVQQAQQAGDADGDEPLGAPAAAVYEGHSGGIIDTLQDLAEKAASALDDARKKETSAAHNFEMLKQSLEDEIKFAAKDMDEAKKGIAESSEKKSTAEGALQVSSKDLAADIEAKATLHHDCMTKAEDFEAETQSRGEELNALAEAKKIIEESTGGDALAQVSFVQVGLSSRSDLTKLEAVRFVRDLARKQQSSALAQLASRMASAMHAAGGADVFEKVKGLISDMIVKLEAEAGADATKKAYCDKQLSETNAKKTDKSDEIEKLSTKIDQAAARSAQLKEEVATLESELSALTKSQAEMDKLRQEEKAAYEANKAEQDQALAGIKLALQVLRDYYAKKDTAHAAATGAASGIIGLLEVCESDISKELAEITSEEEAAVTEYEAVSKENEIEKTTKEQDVLYKTQESKSLDETSAELSADRNGVQAELDAILEYLSKIEEECIAKAETYEERKKRREAEISGLKEALTILESETALVQERSARRTLRGGARRGRLALAVAA